ncbi:MAG: hypothetical protein NC824_02120 [Candidatus Omnitrophica bacterium]|nr:hypothetical protein [Candidatus Omnitrophota bacterium]
MSNSKKRLSVLILFAIAMGYVEAMVVVYLRYLIPVSEWSSISTYRDLCVFIRNTGIMWSEQTREFATIIMLFCVAFLFGKTIKEKLASFLVAFGIWDIFYYLFLYLWLRWPENLFVWDVLFLIPSPWVSPVIIPVCVSIVMITTGYYLLFHRVQE